MTIFTNQKTEDLPICEFEEIQAPVKNKKIAGRMYRAKVPNGWIVSLRMDGAGLTFIPDSNHKWDGCSIK